MISQFAGHLTVVCVKRVLSLAAKLFEYVLARCITFHNARLTMALGLGRRARATPAQEGSSGPSPSSLQMGAQAVRQMQLLGPCHLQTLRQTATGGRHRDRWRIRRASSRYTASTEANASVSDERASRRKRRQKRVIAAEESRGSTCGIPGSGSTTELHRRTRAGSAKADEWNANTKYQEAEALVASAADVLVSALEAEKVLREQARTERTMEDNDFESKMTAAELHEVLRNVIGEGVEPPGAQSPIGLQEAVSVARATLAQTSDKDKQQRAREAEAGPQDEQRFPSAGGSRA